MFLHGAGTLSLLQNCQLLQGMTAVDRIVIWNYSNVFSVVNKCTKSHLVAPLLFVLEPAFTSGMLEHPRMLILVSSRTSCVQICTCRFWRVNKSSVWISCITAAGNGHVVLSCEAEQQEKHSVSMSLCARFISIKYVNPCVFCYKIAVIRWDKSVRAPLPSSELSSPWAEDKAATVIASVLHSNVISEISALIPVDVEEGWGNTDR